MHGRHSREGGNPFLKLEQALIWVPASAGTTLRTELQAFQPVRRLFHTLEGGNPFQPMEQDLSWVPAFAGTTLRQGARTWSR